MPLQAEEEHLVVNVDKDNVDMVGDFTLQYTFTVPKCFQIKVGDALKRREAKVKGRDPTR